MGEYSKNLGDPDETIRFPGVTEDLVDLGDVTVGRTVHEPGWRWSTHARPLVGGEWCEARHLGIVLSGRLGIKLRDGTTFELGADDVYHIPPGHDGYTIGDEPCVVVEWAGLRAFAGFRSGPRNRVLATLLFVSLAGSASLAERLGDVAWRELLSTFYELVRSELERFGGNEVKTTEDGLLARFEGPARAVQFAAEIRRKAGRDELRVRAGVHVGEVELVGSDVRGLAVLAGARLIEAAAPDEILVSEITRTLALPSGLTFEERGTHELAGLAGGWPLFAYVDPPDGSSR